MKKIYTMILALAAVMALGGAAKAQDVPYLMNKDHGIGYNKYIVTDQTTGERKIRIETFATGGGERKAIPADICLVLDNSGSMLYYYVTNSSDYKRTLTQAQVDAPTIPDAQGKKKDPLLVVDDLSDFTGQDTETSQYFKGYDYNRLSTKAFGESNGISSSYAAFTNKQTSATGLISMQNCFRYAKHTDGKYYVIYHKTMTIEGVAWYYLCYQPESGPEMYLRNTEFTSTRPTDSCFKSSNKTLFVGATNGTITVNGESVSASTLLYRAKTRKEKLEEGVNAFINEIYANNQVIEPDLEPGKVGNQIAIVAFGSPGSMSLSPYETGDPMNGCRIVKTFTAADSEANVTLIKGGLDRMSFLGNTSLGYGMVLANEAFRLLRNNQPEMDAYEMEDDGVTYKTDAAGHPIPNRSKVVVVFTDGAPTAEHEYTSSAAAPYTSLPGCTQYTDGSDAVRARSIDYSNLMKNSAAGSLNAKVFTIGLYATGTQKTLLEHVSSNYPVYPTPAHYDGHTVNSSGSINGYLYSPANGTSNLYFMDAGEQDLKEVFEVIASIAGGKSDVGGTSMINIDIVSKSFRVPKQEGVDLKDMIKVYTAQCLGLELDKTYEEDGHTKHYLAFDEPVEAGTRDLLDVLWVSNVDDTTGEVTWTKETAVDVDGAISVTVEDDPDGNNDIIKVTGFDYAKLWCGLDGDANHADNTKQYNVSDYGDFDAGTGPYIKGYRGFKIIIDIPIALQDNAVGGPQVNTNEPGSGLMDPETGTLLVPYPRPQLIIPVNLWIQKEGLMKNESATFTIQRKLAKPTDENPDPQYEYFTSVNVIGDVEASGASKPVMVKILNLDPAYFYRVVEQGWTWAYTSDAQDELEAPSTETVLTNPIVIKNTPKPTTPKHDEAVKRNDM